MKLAAALLFTSFIGVLPICSKASEIDPQIDKILQVLKSDSISKNRKKAALALGKSNSSNPLVHQALAFSLEQDSKDRVREAAADALGDLMPSDIKIVVSMIVASKVDASIAVRVAAMFAVKIMAEKEKLPRATLEYVLATTNIPKIRGFVVDILLKMDKDDVLGKAEWLRALDVLEKDPDPKNREDALTILEEVDFAGPRCKEVLLHAIQDDSNAQVRKRAITVLYLNNLVDRCDYLLFWDLINSTQDEQVRVAAAHAFSVYSSSHPLEMEVVDLSADFLLNIHKERNPDVVRIAASMLNSMESKEIRFINVAIFLLRNSSDEVVRMNAIGALEQIEPEHLAARYALIRTYETDPSAFVRDRAHVVLCHLPALIQRNRFL